MRTFKKALSGLLALSLVLSCVPAPAYAAEMPTEPVVVETTAATVPETTEATVPATTEPTVPETTEATVPATTEPTVPETTEATVPATTEAAEPKSAEAAVPVEIILGTSDQAAAASDDGWTIFWGSENRVEWKLDSGTLTIRGTGKIPEGSSMSYPWSTSDDEITAVVIESGITNVPEQAFKRYANLVSVTFPDTMLDIRSQSFYKCSALTSVRIPSSVQNIRSSAFYGTGLTTVYVNCTKDEWDNKTIFSSAFPEGVTFVYACTVNATANEGGTVTGSGRYDEGAKATVTATADDGYVFVNWTENGTVVSTDATYTFTMSDADRDLVANFVPHQHNWAYSADADNHTIIAACQKSPCSVEGGQVTVTMAAPENLVYDGTRKSVVITQTPEEVFSDLSVSYEGDRKSVGAHTASLTMGNAAVALTFTITCDHTMSENNGTDNKDGTHNRICSVCQETMAANEAHSFGSDGKCSVCEARKSYTVTVGDGRGVAIDGVDTVYHGDPVSVVLTNTMDSSKGVHICTYNMAGENYLIEEPMDKGAAFEIDSVTGDIVIDARAYVSITVDLVHNADLWDSNDQLFEKTSDTTATMIANNYIGYNLNAINTHFDLPGGHRFGWFMVDGERLGADYIYTITGPAELTAVWSCTHLGQNGTHHNSKASTCHTQGNIAYFACEKYPIFMPLDGEYPITMAETLLPLDPDNHEWNEDSYCAPCDLTCDHQGHSQTKCETCRRTDQGIHSYDPTDFTCTDCGKVCNHETSLNPKDGKCTACGAFAAKAMLNDTYILGLPEAMVEAQVGDTVTALANYDYPFPIPYGVAFHGGEYSFAGNHITNEGVIVSGTFSGLIINNYRIEGGTFNGSVDNNRDIVSGSFNRIVSNDGTIEGGTFSGRVLNNGTIEGGAFSTTSAVTNTGTISGGTFAGTVDNDSTIGGGTFQGTVNSKGTIETGTFTAASTVNSSYIIKNGTFDGSVNVLNNGIIQGGTFSSEVVLNSGAEIRGGTFSGKLTNSGTVVDHCGRDITVTPDFVYVAAEGGTVTGEHGTISPVTCNKPAVCKFCGEYGTKDESLHQYEYTVTEGKITLTCSVCDGDFGSLTLVAPAELVYNGEAKAFGIDGEIKNVSTPTVKYTQGTTELAGAPTDAGNYTASITILNPSDNNNPVTAKLDFTIEKATPVVTAPVAVTGLVYNGADQTLITAGSTTGGTIQYSLDDGQTWTDTVPQGKDADTYSVSYRVVGNDNYFDVDPQVIPVTLAPCNLSGDTVTLSADAVTYNGTEQKPAVTVTGLTENTDYTVTYPEDMTNASQKTITITGKGNYAGTVEKTFEIQPLDTISAHAAVVIYNGVANTYTFDLSQVLPDDPSYTWGENVRFNRCSVLLDRDGYCESAFIDGNNLVLNINAKDSDKEWVAGNCEVKGTSQNTEEIRILVSFKTKNRTDVSSQITISAPQITYGSEPNVTCSLNGTSDGEANWETLYSNDGGSTWKPLEALKVNGKLPAGSYTVKLCYTDDSQMGEASATFTVAKATPAPEMPASLEAVYGNWLRSVALPSTNWSWDDPIGTTVGNVGTNSFTATYTPDDQDNYNAVQFSLDITVNPKDISDAKITVKGTYTYNGKPHSPELEAEATLYADPGMGYGQTMVKNTDYTVTYADNVNAGTASVILTGKGNYTGTVTQTFSIGKATPTVTAPKAKTGLTYSGKAQKLITAGSTTGGTMEYSVNNGAFSTAIPTGTNATTYNIRYRVVGGTNYEDAPAQEIQASIGKAKVTIKADNKSAAVGASKPALTYTVTGLKGSDKLTTKPALNCSANMKVIGKFDITVTGGDAGSNYKIKHVNGKLTVNGKVAAASATNGSISLSSENAAPGSQVAVTVTPKSGYKLATLTVKDAAGNSCTVSADNNGKYYFTMPASSVTVKATFTSSATADSTNPKTADTSMIVFWSGMLMTTMLGAAMLLNKRKFFEM